MLAAMLLPRNHFMPRNPSKVSGNISKAKWQVKGVILCEEPKNTPLNGIIYVLNGEWPVRALLARRVGLWYNSRHEDK